MTLTPTNPAMALRVAAIGGCLVVGACLIAMMQGSTPSTGWLQVMCACLVAGVAALTISPAVASTKRWVRGLSIGSFVLAMAGFMVLALATGNYHFDPIVGNFY